MITTSNLKYSFNASSQLTFPDWEVLDGEHGLILGPSGCGKTTFLHLLSGLIKPTFGSIQYDEVAINDLGPREMDQFRGENIGLVFQKPHLIAALTVRQNIQLATFFGKKPEQNEQIEGLLESLGLVDLVDRKINEISQGQAQRVAIARALINSPKVIFGDEPTASLDDASCEKVIQLLQEQAEKHNATLVLATHDHRVKSHFSNQLQL